MNGSEAFNPREVGEALTRYDSLRLVSPGTIEGRLDICAEYERRLIQDHFDVRIERKNSNSVILPAVYETGVRIDTIARRLGVSDTRNLHRNPDGGSLCLCVKQQEREKFPPGSSLLTFIENLVVPYFYALSHYEATGRWLWGEYTHGALGLLEFYEDSTRPQTKEELEEVIAAIRLEPTWAQFRKQMKNPASKRDCPCGSGINFGKCHPKAYRGVKTLAALLQHHGIAKTL